MAAGFEASCASCHATCGSCHVSRPASVGGGLVDSHVFGPPSMIDQCTACHGSRVGDEFRGMHRDAIPDYEGDVHYLAGMRCPDCHEAEEMHAGAAAHRYAVPQMPRCEDCHDDVAMANEYHREHQATFACQVCHAQDYKQCASCHVPTGVDDPSWLGFKIGRNPLPEDRPYLVVTLRHVPIVPDTFEGWGYEQVLAQFDLSPTWKYASPHAIRLRTDRTAPGDRCRDACHGTPATPDGWFLRQGDLDAMPVEAPANQHLILPNDRPERW